VRLDRLLLDANGGEWIGDYKSSSPKELAGQARRAAALRGRSLQLPLYRLARVAEGARVAGLEFLALRRLRPRKGEERFHSFPLDELPADDAGFADTLDALLALREAGTFPLDGERETGRSQCGRCDFRRACRHSHAPTAGRVDGAPSSARYLALAQKEKRTSAEEDDA
jgi:hypothetical protein